MIDEYKIILTTPYIKSCDRHNVINDESFELFQKKNFWSPKKMVLPEKILARKMKKKEKKKLKSLTEKREKESLSADQEGRFKLEPGNTNLC